VHFARLAPASPYSEPRALVGTKLRSSLVHCLCYVATFACLQGLVLNLHGWAVDGMVLHTCDLYLLRPTCLMLFVLVIHYEYLDFIFLYCSFGVTFCLQHHTA